MSRSVTTGKGKGSLAFCYLANGMKAKDMIYPEYKNINGEFIVFERAKPERSNRLDSGLIAVL